MKLINKALLMLSFLAIESKNNKIEVVAVTLFADHGILLLKTNSGLKKLKINTFVLEPFFSEMIKESNDFFKAKAKLEQMTLDALKEYFNENAEEKINTINNKILLIFGDENKNIKILYLNETKVNHQKIIKLIKEFGAEEGIIKESQKILDSCKIYGDGRILIIRDAGSIGVLLLLREVTQTEILIRKKANELQMTEAEITLASNIIKEYLFTNSLSNITIGLNINKKKLF